MMKRGRRDKILTTAFGDGDSLDLNGLTDEERAEFEDALRLSEGLKTLRDVPECQLSKERLISAVLSSAVKKRQTFAWGYAAAVAGAIVVMALFALQSSLINMGGEKDDKVAFDQPSTNEVISPMDMIPDPPAITRSTEEKPAPSESPGTDAVAAPAPMVHEDGPLPSDTPDPVGLGTVVASNDGLGASIENAALEAGDSAKVTTAALEDAEPVARQPLVIVDSALEDENGTYVATELETFGDVVFGG